MVAGRNYLYTFNLINLKLNYNTEVGINIQTVIVSEIKPRHTGIPHAYIYLLEYAGVVWQGWVCVMLYQM